jgi:exopolysaccharide production protein ExoZ
VNTAFQQITCTASTGSAVTPAKSETLISVQVLRALAALGVTIFHLRPYFGINLGIRDVLPTYLSVGAAGVHVFFVISGFVILHSSAKLIGQPGSSREFFVRRCIRIVPLYWGVSLVVLLHTLVQHGASALPRSAIASFAFIPAARSNGLMYPIVVPGWTLNFEMFFYVVFALGLLYRRNSVAFGVSAFCASISAFFAGIVVLSALTGPLPQPFAFWTNAMILEFVVGMFLALIYRKGFTVSGWVSVSLIGIGIIILGFSASGCLHVPRGTMWAAAAALIVSGAVLGPKLDARRAIWRPLNLLGDASYSLYLVHGYAFGIPLRVFRHAVDPIAAPWMYASLIVVTAVAAAIAVHLFIERPITRALFQLWSHQDVTKMREANLSRGSAACVAVGRLATVSWARFGDRPFKAA